MIKMKALTSFTGSDGKVRAGREFEVATEARADDLERQRLAERVVTKARAVQPPRYRGDND